jgi:para-nitrobenzyl esterase
MLRTLVTLIISLLLGACGAGPETPRPTPGEVEPATQRTLSTGNVVGFRADNGAMGWLGIPYAAPPVGPLRWRAPQPAPSWPGTLEATQIGSACLQRGSWLGGAPAELLGKLFGSEDCLFLNIWTPAQTPPEGLPVMVWIHGGGNTTGHGGFYDFSQMATRFNLVMLSFNYRLGGLGWFYHPGLWTEEDGPLDRSGNFGLLDQVELLRWVKQNIRAFGGNPERVSIFGESAGGQDTLALMVSPTSAGLFHGAIAQSGYTTTVTPQRAHKGEDGAEAVNPGASEEMLLYWLQEEDLADSREAAVAYRDSMSPSEINVFLRSLSSDHLVMGYYSGSENHSAPIMIADGAVIPEEGIAKAYQAGRFHRVPLIAGTNRDENNLWLVFSPELVKKYFGVFYRPKDETRYRFFSEYRAKGWKARGADDPSRWVRSAGGDAFAYRWDWDEEPQTVWADFALLVGAAHGLETTFLTGVFPKDGLAGMLFTKANEEGRLALSQEMQSYWAEFAYTGKPGRGRDNELPPWMAWNLEKGADKFMVLDTPDGGGIRMSKDEVFSEELLLTAASDERARSEEDICWLVYLNLKEGPLYSPDQYRDWNKGRCLPYPPSHFDAKAS